MTWKERDTLKLLVQKIEDDEILTKKEVQEALKILMQKVWEDTLE